jgi:uncharacterized repeat protein (TIGR02543 family)
LTPRGGGVSPSSKQVKLGENYGDLPTPTKTGYTHSGWTTSDGAIVVSTTQNTTIGDHTLTAQWLANTIKVLLNANGGSGGTSNFYFKYGTAKYYSDSSCSTQITSVTNPTRTGYSFSRWYGDGSSGGTNGETYSLFGSGDLFVDIYKDATLYAEWSANTITITLNKNGGSGGTDTFYYKYNTNKFYSDSACTSQITTLSLPSRNGYSFVHYYGDGSCGGSSGERYAGYSDVSYGFASDLCYDIYKNATLTASWSANTITITLNKNGGSGGTSTFYYKYNTNAFYSDSACTSQITSITKPKKKGYTLVSFYGDGSCGGSNGERYVAYDSVNFASDLCYDIYKNATLYANWTTCTICGGRGYYYETETCSWCSGTGESSSRKKITCSTTESCSQCGGSGTLSGGNRECTKCSGSGNVTCTTCKGKGYYYEYVTSTCSWCGGSGEEDERYTCSCCP